MYTENIKKLAIEKRLNGEKINDIASELKMNEKTLRRWFLQNKIIVKKKLKQKKEKADTIKKAIDTKKNLKESQKESKKKRSNRTHQLILNGIGMEKSGLIHYPNTIIIGYLKYIEFHTYTPDEIARATEEGKELFKTKMELNATKDKELKRRWIEYGVILEKSRLNKQYNNNTILGFMNQIHHFNEKSIDYFEKLGQ